MNATLSTLSHYAAWVLWLRGLLRFWGRCLLPAGKLLAAVAAVLMLSQVRTAWSIGDFLLLASIAALFLAASSTTWGDRRTWLLYIVLFGLFAQLRRLADDAGMPAQFDYAVALERALAFGAIPSEWLQSRFYTAGTVAPWDAYLSVIYVSYFIAPHLMLLAVWRLRPAFFSHVIAAVLITLYVGVAAAVVLPTAPPWLAAETGDIDNVIRVLPELAAAGSPDAYEQGHRVAGGNEVAAMPSLHMAITVIVAIVMWRARGPWRPLSLLYAASMALALVYLGEHYVVDEAAGVLTALAAWKLAPALLSALSAVVSRRRPSASEIASAASSRAVYTEQQSDD